MDVTIYIEHIINSINSSDKIAIILAILGFIWTFFKIKEFREFKHWIQFDIDANIYPLSRDITTYSYNWSQGDGVTKSLEDHTHAIEILFKFNNKGKTRIKIYNIQAEFRTSLHRSGNYLNNEEGHLRFNRPPIVTGNIVPKNVGFYYIEPQVEQTITYLTLIKIPGDIISILGRFCQDNVRIYPEKESGRKYFKHFSNFQNSLCKNIFGRTYAFNWNKISGEDEPRKGDRRKGNERLIRFLAQRLHIDWAEDAIIRKIDEIGITVSTKEHSLLLNLNDKRSEVILEKDNIRLKKKLKAEMENNGLNIYENPIYGWILKFLYDNYCTRLLSHTVQRTYFLDPDGFIIR
jgi:hypothetical protein